MKKPRICASIVDHDIEAVKKIEPRVDLFEVRIDLIGPAWFEMVKFIKKPWIACNRNVNEGGKALSGEAGRVEELVRAAANGACYVDIEYRTENLKEVVPLIKTRAKCLISFHDVTGTPPYDTLAAVVKSQLRAGANVCKIVTTARSFADNLTVLKLIDDFPEVKLVAFAMGDAGVVSRVLCPLVGGYFTYACMAHGKESASGQRTVEELRKLYRYIKR
jgi:3-dehydroquinate dehydratase I